MLTQYKAMIGLMVLAVALAGCSRHAATTTGRARGTSPQIGDKAVYSFQGIVFFQGARSGIRSTGRDEYTVIAPTGQVRAMSPPIVRVFDLAQDHEQRMFGRRRSSRLVIRLGQDSLGNLYLLGKSRDGRTYDYVTNTTPPLYQPAQITTGSAWQHAVSYSNGDTQSATYRCVGMERVKTQAGEYNAYKVSVDLKLSTSPRATGYVWISASLPRVFELKSELSSNEPVRGIAQTSNVVSTLESVSLAN